MKTEDYLRESVSRALDKVGLTASDEQLAELARAVHVDVNYYLAHYVYE